MNRYFWSLLFVPTATALFGQSAPGDPVRAEVEWRTYADLATPWRRYERLQGYLDGVWIEGAEAVIVRRPDGQTERHVFPELPEGHPGPHPMDENADRVWLIRDQQWIAAQRSEDYRAHPLRRVRRWHDANGRLLDSLDLVRRFDTLISAKVFAPDPLSRANVPYGGLYVDGNDGNAAVLDSLRQSVSVRVTWNGSGFVLANSAASIQEFDPPAVTVPVLTSANAVFSRSDAEFEMLNALFHLNAWKSRMATLGYGSMVPYSIPVDVNAYGGADQSAFDYATNPPRLYFGEGGVDDAEDPDVLVHEYGHAMCYAAAPGTNISVQRQALEEAICDYFAVSWSLEWSPNRWADVFTWDGHNTFWAGRSAVNSTQKMYPGLVFTGPYSHTSVLVDALVRGRQRVGGAVMDGLVMEALYSLSSSTSFTQFAEAVLHADTVKYAGTHADGLRLDFGSWQILSPGMGHEEEYGSSARSAVVVTDRVWPFGDREAVELWDLLGRPARLVRGRSLPAQGVYLTAEGVRVLVIPQ
ncbi:MAG: hypothetical protein ACKOX0_04830 [Bacteroidota bacterium]